MTLRAVSGMRNTVLLIGVALVLVLGPVHAGDDASNIVRNVNGEGSCAIVGMSAEQSQLIALQRARTEAIEKAADIRVSSQSIVTNFRLAADFIRTYSEGFIIHETVEWLPLGQYQKDSSTAPVPEYRVKITADVYKPDPKIRPIGLVARANGSIFKSGEKAKIHIETGRKATIGIFNITADDRVVMLYPNQYERDSSITEGQALLFPPDDSQVELVMGTLPGHERDAEAFFVAAMDDSSMKKFSSLFSPMKPMKLTSFFRVYSEIADYCEDTVIAYEVVGDASE
jgi:hypothetical protein